MNSVHLLENYQQIHPCQGIYNHRLLWYFSQLFLSVFFYALAFQLSVTVSCAIPASIKLSNRLGQFKKKKTKYIKKL